MAGLRTLVSTTLAEDFGSLGDLTSIATIPDDAVGTGAIIARRFGVLAGVAAANEVFRQVDSRLSVRWLATDGDAIEADQTLATISGNLRSLLGAERSALNLLQHASGIASLTREYVQAAAGRTHIRDTRKTLPGLRAVEKAAVRAGGGFNHRECLSDSVLIKDNHLAFLDLTAAVERSKVRWPGRTVEVECDTLAQVHEAVAAGADFILLDNMSPDDVRVAVDAVDGMVPLEVSGGVTFETIHAYAATGVEFVSIGALTHSAPALDIALDIVPALD
ncbi:MAG: carboxylating nicotinate-nucleotide diphosphorylase [Acidimicrobiia bacterium]|nr:carboxylating nicotinate-nucleotide diphosphorylase [Acidimicrobiia bacterium]